MSEEWTEGEKALYDQLAQNAEGAADKAAEGRLAAAFEEFRVGHAVARMALKTNPRKLTEERVELASRLAWAQSELELGYGSRVPDDLETVGELAAAVHDQD